MMVDAGNKEIIVLPQEFFNPRDHQRSVGIPQIVGDNSQSVGALLAQGAGQQIRTIIELPRRRMNTVPRNLRNVCCRRRVVKHTGNRPSRQADMTGHRLQSRGSRFFTIIETRHTNSYLLLQTTHLAGSPPTRVPNITRAASKNSVNAEFATFIAAYMNADQRPDSCRKAGKSIPSCSAFLYK